MFIHQIVVRLRDLVDMLHLSSAAAVEISMGLDVTPSQAVSLNCIIEPAVEWILLLHCYSYKFYAVISIRLQVYSRVLVSRDVVVWS